MKIKQWFIKESKGVTHVEIEFTQEEFIDFIESTIPILKSERPTLVFNLKESK